MNKLFIIFSLILWAFIGMLSSCTNPVVVPPIVVDPIPVVEPLPVHYISVLNSKWQIVKQEIMAPSAGSREITSADAIKAEIAAYNAAHINDQWFLVDGEVPTLDNAPPCSIYIVDKVTHDVIIGADGPFMKLGWPRKQLVDNYEGWEKFAIASAGDMYVDVIPPAPLPPTAEQLYAKYSIYVIDSIGAIMYEYHCDVVPEGFLPMTPIQYFSTMLNAVQNIVSQPENANVPWTYISGRVYTAP